MIKLLLYLIPIGLIYLPDLWIKYNFKKNNKYFEDMPFTGKELGKKILEENNLKDIPINSVKDLPIGGCNYDPEKKEINISESIYDRKSITSIAVIVHEIGHAIQDKEKAKLLNLRISLINKTRSLRKAGSILLIIGIPSLFALIKSPLLIILFTLVIILSFSTNVLINLITLPNEIDASFKKALPILKRYAPKDNLKQCRSVLVAAAFTYLAASIRSILSLRLIFLALFRR